MVTLKGRIADLERQLADEARLNGMGVEREVDLRGQGPRLERALAKAQARIARLDEIIRLATDRFAEVVLALGETGSERNVGRAALDAWRARAAVDGWCGSAPAQPTVGTSYRLVRWSVGGMHLGSVSIRRPRSACWT